MEHETVTSQENGERLIKLGLVGAVVLFFATGAIFDPFSSEQDAYTMIARLLSGLLCFLLVARGWKLIRNKSDRLDDILDIVFGSILVVALIVLTGYVLIVKPTPEPPGSRCSSCVNGELMEGAVSRMAATPDDHSDGVFFEKLRDLYSAVLKEDSPKGTIVLIVPRNDGTYDVRVEYSRIDESHEHRDLGEIVDRLVPLAFSDVVRLAFRRLDKVHLIEARLQDHDDFGTSATYHGRMRPAEYRFPSSSRADVRGAISRWEMVEDSARGKIWTFRRKEK